MEQIEQTPLIADVVTLWQALGAEIRGAALIFAILTLTALVAFIVARFTRYLEGKLSHNRTVWDDALVHALRKPLVFFVWLLGFFWAAEVAYFYSDAEIFAANAIVLRVGMVWLIAWTGLRFVREVEKVVVSSRVKHPVDLTTVSAVGKLARAVVILTAGLIIMQSLGYSISGVLAFGGLGGIAIGFAAKDLLANFFGGAMIYMDRPFKVGDWISSPDREIEGSVERIGWRLTTIRTFALRPLYVPNSIFTTVIVENPSRMLNRRIYQVIGIRYADIRVMGDITDQVGEMLRNHEEVDTDQIIMANFEKFGPSSLDFFIYCYLKTTNWAKYHAVLQEVLLRVSQIIEENGAEVALPARAMHFAGPVSVREEREIAENPGSAGAKAEQDSSQEKGTSAGSADQEQALARGPRDQRELSEAELASQRRSQTADQGPLSESDGDPQNPDSRSKR